MKSIYIDNQLHSQLKFLAAFEKKALTALVEAFLEKEVREKLSDLPPELLQQLANEGKSFDFLKDEAEDIYSSKDGTRIS